MSPQAPDLTGIALDGRYELHELIGEGTFGRVYRGRDRRLARDVAIKVIKPWWAEDPEWVESFQREAQLLASINDPGIVQIYDVGSADEGQYYVAELIRGESLARRLARGPLTSDEAAALAAQLCHALARAHADRIVHRDVKPQNVLISEAGQVKVGDFGVARLAQGSSGGVAASVAGTPRYMAPEQARGGPVTPATDVYGVGVVLYEMLAGRPPFTGETAIELALAHVSDPPPPLPTAIAPELAAIVERALAKAPADRFGDGAEMAAALERAAPATRGTAPSPSTAANGSSRAGTPATPAAATGSPRIEEGRPPVGEEATPAATRIGDPRGPRRNVNPSERRQRIALFALAALIIAGLLAAGVALAPGHVHVPLLTGRGERPADAALSHAGLHAAVARRYSDSIPAGTVIAQAPRAGTSVGDGSSVRLTVSAGPPPVPVPVLTGAPESAAAAKLAAVGLRVDAHTVVAPGTAAGVVVSQAPAAGSRAPRGSAVALAIAEQPRFRPLTSVSGTAAGQSVPFRIRGRGWQLRATMGYIGTCTFVFFCSGPSAIVRDLTSGRTVDSFDLSDGGVQTRTETAGPGTYQVVVKPGSDSARWQIAVEDHY